VWRRVVLDDGRPDVGESESGEIGLRRQFTLVGRAQVDDDANALRPERVDPGWL
jgi:hypothetical protein